MIRLTQISVLMEQQKKKHAHFQELIPLSSVPAIRLKISCIQSNIMRHLNKHGKKTQNILKRQKKLTETASKMTQTWEMYVVFK